MSIRSVHSGSCRRAMALLGAMVLAAGLTVITGGMAGASPIIGLAANTAGGLVVPIVTGGQNSPEAALGRITKWNIAYDAYLRAHG